MDKCKSRADSKVETRKTVCLGHMLRNVKQRIKEGKDKSNKGRARRIILWLHNIKQYIHGYILHTAPNKTEM